MENARTQIIATLGPATSEPAIMRKLLGEGADVFRVNLSHGERERHRLLIRQGAETGAKVMLDLQGPKVRIASGSAGLPHRVRAGEQVVFCNNKCPPPGERIVVYTISEKIAWKCIAAGTKILVDDGNIEFRVVAGEDWGVVAEAVVDGLVGAGKGVAFDHDVVDAPDVLERDQAALEDLAAEPFEYVAVSFARNAKCISGLRRFAGAGRHLVAKIEDPAGVRNAEEIIQASDAVMVARGDLGVCMPLPALPVLQKRLIALGNYHRKPVIVATQMLESMVGNPRPTRAEVSDVANAIFDGADMLMLSAETAVGKHPVRAVKMLASIIVEAEKAVRTGLKFQL